MPESLALPALLVVGGGLLVWYLAGNELMRRRGHRLAVWSKRALDPLGGTQSILWLTPQAFRLEVDAPRAAGLKRVSVTGLVESWDVPMIWLWNRWRGRRDMVVLSLSLAEQPLWGFEVFRPRSILAADARHYAKLEGWQLEPDEDLMIAAGGDGPRQLARRLLGVLQDERPNLIRLAARRQGALLTMALTVARPA